MWRSSPVQVDQSVILGVPTNLHLRFGRMIAVSIILVISKYTYSLLTAGVLWQIYISNSPTNVKCKYPTPPTSYSIIDASASRPAGEPEETLDRGQAGASTTDPGNQIQIDVTAPRYSPRLLPIPVAMKSH